jgi:hypothetical protein
VIPDTPSVSQLLSQVIAQDIAPAFILGALAAFISLLILRMNRVVDRSQALNAIGGDEPARVHPKTDLPRLKLRAVLLNKAIRIDQRNIRHAAGDGRFRERVLWHPARARNSGTFHHHPWSRLPHRS